MPKEMPDWMVLISHAIALFSSSTVFCCVSIAAISLAGTDSMFDWLNTKKVVLPAKDKTKNINA